MYHVRNLFGIEVEVRNRENLESDKPYILVINHQSSLDCFGKSFVSKITDLRLKKKIQQMYMEENSIQ